MVAGRIDRITVYEGELSLQHADVPQRGNTRAADFLFSFNIGVGEKKTVRAREERVHHFPPV